MAVRARLAPPREAQTDWPWHKLKSASLRASLLFGDDRRMEAENFLARGFGTRLAIESKSAGWSPLLEVARTWQPLRLKGIQVSPEFGTPFLAATQVYDLRPIPRKWLSLDRTSHHAERFVSEGTILVTCSGSVGRATLAHSTVEGTLVSHDLLRIEAKDRNWLGWVYAYLRAPTVREMMKAAQYGHIIKHLETHHLDQLPIVMPNNDALLAHCNDAVERVIWCRNEAIRKIKDAEHAFADCFPAVAKNSEQAAFFTRASQSLFSGRRRFDAWSQNPERAAVERSLKQGAKAWTTLRQTGCLVWLPNRFRRIPAEDGVQLIDSSQIFEVNPDYERRISASGISDKNDGFVKPGWLMMSRSGQIYGLLGSVAIATERHEGKVVSDDIIRIEAGDAVSPGYLYAVLGHPYLGRPRAKSLAYGSSIPHIEVEDLKDFPIPRLDPRSEQRVADLVEKAFAMWSEADETESQLAVVAETELGRFLDLRS